MSCRWKVDSEISSATGTIAKGTASRKADPDSCLSLLQHTTQSSLFIALEAVAELAHHLPQLSVFDSQNTFNCFKTLFLRFSGTAGVRMTFDRVVVEPGKTLFFECPVGGLTNALTDLIGLPESVKILQIVMLL